VIRAKIESIQSSIRICHDDDVKLKELKVAEQLLKTQGARIIHLLSTKQLAIENEDYHTAKNIKVEVEKIRAAIATMDEATGQLPHEAAKSLSYFQAARG
jgi:hypothetical protein